MKSKWLRTALLNSFSFEPDLIMLDMKMPGMNGIENRRVAVIMMHRTDTLIPTSYPTIKITASTM